ncbi:sigma-E factor negative regulatory protein [Uliginosibacterium gangwonense]|uniref:sigma-E factor negative regulatory protein n=1 Tax=Uliginosibacterium gangwonense TaxID=392736 RepID=UPI0003A792D4|nr:sigma-E factor negative regulatory protein [Uliginosibacterium gangwonense]
MLNEQLSAWCDGESSDHEGASSQAFFPGSAEQRADCELAWLIGDALRGEPALSEDFTSKVMQALAAEPVVLVPAAMASHRKKVLKHPWMAMAAAVSGVLVAGWMVASMWSGGAANPALLARAPAPVPVVAASGAEWVASAQPALAPAKTSSLAPDATYLMAHQASSGGAPIADVAHFIRTVSDDDQQGAGR